jgi:hypothetical protein
LPAVDQRAALFRRSPEVEETRVGDRIVLYHPQSGNSVVLNPTATILWDELRADTDIHQLSTELSTRFNNIDHDTIFDDVRVCLEELRNEQLIQQIN